jgi:MFS transporter, DHA1 family, inner membrane transport protein
LTTLSASQSAGRTEITRLLSVILLSRLVINTAFRMSYAFVPEFSQGLGIDLPAMGALISARSFAGMLAPVFGSVSDRYGRRPVMYSALVLLIVCATLAYLSPSLIFFAVGFVGLGLAKIMFEPSGSAFLGDRVPYARRGLVLGMSELGWATGGLIGVPIAARAIALWGWQSPYALIALGGALALVWAAVTLPRCHDSVHQAQRVDTRAAFSAVARHRSAMVMLCVAALFLVGGELIAVSYASWLSQTFQLDVIALGGIVATFALADVGGEVLSMLAVDRFGKKRALLAGYCATTLFYFVLPALGASLPVAVAALFLYYVCFEFTIVSVFPLVSELAPEARGTMLSLTTLAASVGRTIGGLGGAALFALGGFGANGVVAGLAVGAATVLFAVGVRERH